MDDGLTVGILDVKSDGTAVWGIGIWAVEVSATGVPTGIKSKDDKDATFNTVLNVEAFTDSTVFDLCTVVVDDVEYTNTTDVADEETSTGTGDRRLQTKRQLGWGSAPLTGTHYCGKSSKTHEGPCASKLSGANYDHTHADAACRMHDHGRKITYAQGLGNRLECAVDQNLLNARNDHNTVRHVVGTHGMAFWWGCSDYGLKATWVPVKNRWGRTYWWKRVDVLRESVRYGANRYKDATSQPNNMIWGYRPVGLSHNGADHGVPNWDHIGGWKYNGAYLKSRAGNLDPETKKASDGWSYGYKNLPTCKESLCVNVYPCPSFCTKRGWMTEEQANPNWKSKMNNYGTQYGVAGAGGACYCNPRLTNGVKDSDGGTNKRGVTCVEPGIPLSGGNNNGAKNLNACVGECDNDEQCAEGLKCFQRPSGSYMKIPGCSGKGWGGWDYCYKPPGYGRPKYSGRPGGGGQGH